MSQELGRIERPEAAPFKPERKVYLVPLILAPPNPPADYAQILERYWSGASEHVEKLETRIGAVKHVYVELVDRGGQEGLAIIQQFSQGAANFAANRVERGAAFEALEDAETLAEAMDWERCLLAGLLSRKANEYVSQAHREAANRRYEWMAKRLDETLREGEAGLLFLTEHHRVQFPDSIRVFYVAPPALDEVHRWLRSYRERAQATAPEQEDEGQTGAEGSAPEGGK